MEGFTILYQQMHGETGSMASQSKGEKPVHLWQRLGRKCRHWAAVVVTAGTQLLRSYF